ncbi:hypothetical protein [Alteribacillus sp. HJP-4]|uniref:hypothetical protein n=1 Tax=Alteribacillus sp. HJP-4 TaxID=2775394 RepID=UPI0035CD1810
MSTQREKQLQKLEEKLDRYHELIIEINTLTQHLGNETYAPGLLLYKEQKDQLEDIMTYFDETGVPTEQNTVEAILTLSLKEFHQYLMNIKNEK